MKECNMKETLSVFLGFLKYKVDNDILSLDELDSMGRVIAENMKLKGTVYDFSEFYGQPVTNVRTVIKRHMPLTHERAVLYPFYEFNKHIPSKWHERRSKRKENDSFATNF